MDRIAGPGSIAVMGAGRVGTAIVRALQQTDLKVFGPFGRGRMPPPVDIVLICVSDDHIAAVASGLNGAAEFVGHVSGATPLTALAAAGGTAFGLHPLQTFAGDDPPQRFHGVGCAVAGVNPAAVEVAEFLAETLQMRPFRISDDARAGYHASACLASNYLITLLDSAERVAASAGLAPPDARALLAPLVETAVQNWRELGPAKALTGPVSRGDVLVVQQHSSAVADIDPTLAELFDVLTRLTDKLAGHKLATHTFPAKEHTR